MTGFRVWAPLAYRVRVRLGAEVHDLAAIGNGWWGTSLDAAPGTDYAYLLDEDEHGLPDPPSRWQPRGAHEASRVYDDSAYRWQTDRGRGVTGPDQSSTNFTSARSRQKGPSTRRSNA
jgi:maltooligosyltrehalose trehalohydrolase